MFIRQQFKTVSGKRVAYWALVESYRTDRGPRQRVVAWLGKLDEAGRLGIKQAADDQPPSSQRSLFAESDTEPEWVEVDVKKLRVENLRHFGGPWLVLELIRKLELDQFLQRVMPRGRETVPWAISSLVLTFARLLNPSSELHTAEQWYPKTALPDLLVIPVEKVDDNRLYRALDKLLPHKAALETHLKRRLGELFELEYDLLLYDVTSTYFEGQAKANPLAQRGYSRDQGVEIRKRCISKPSDHQEILLDRLGLRLLSTIKQFKME